jgi:hypothetical protein
LLHRLREIREEIKEEAEKNGENPVTVNSTDKEFCVSLPLQSHSVIQTMYGTTVQFRGRNSNTAYI